MPYSREFFEIQLRFASLLVDGFGVPLTDAVRDYTTFTKSLGSGEGWADYIRGLAAASDHAERVDWSWQWYLPRSGGDPTPQDTHFHGHRLFGCFYYELREDGQVVRPHLIKVADTSHSQESVLGEAMLSARRRQLKALFVDVRENVPDVRIVAGNSWMYNLKAYQRLYPPQFAGSLPESEAGEFQYLSRWGQFFDRDWRVKESMAHTLFDRLSTLDRIEDLRECFPFQILQPRCSIDKFYRFYKIR